MLMNTVLKNIKSLVNTAVIKINKTAKQYETLESIENADAYIAAVQKTDRFDLFSEFDLDIIIEANIATDLETQIQYASNPSTIPKIYQEKVLDIYRQHTITNYVEINSYYRMLNGQPDLEDPETSFIRLTQEQLVKYNILEDVYLHQLSDTDIYKLEDDGLLAEIIANNPDKEYLKYIGDNRIDIITARTSNNFSILKISLGDVPDEFYNTFIQIYEQNREYFTSVLYIPNYSNSYDLYDNFIALCIMLMTIQRVVSNTFKFGIQREFYDWDFIRNLYMSYNIPFVESLPMDYQIILLKNLNNLLRYKSTDKVLFDVASLLGYERLNIFRYFLVKEHKLDENENPIFCYKQKVDALGNPELDEDGNPIYVEDVEKMYDLYFQRVNVKERNLVLALEDHNNKLDYDEVTFDDPYWWEDANLSEAKYNNIYNYVETKYMSLNMLYKMTPMLFEITYAFRMIIDKHDELEQYKIGLPKVYSDMDFEIFDVVIFLVSLLCKNHGFKDGIITTPSMIAHIYGFDFNNESIEKIKSIILNNPKIIDQDIIKYFEKLEITQASDVNELFYRIREYNAYIIEKMRYSQSIEEYHLYKDIFTISMVSETQTNMFNVAKLGMDGTITEKPAKTYLEYLEYKQPILAEVVRDTTKEDISPLLDHVIAQINSFMKDMEYMYILNDNENPVFEALSALIKFFKSYTVDLAGFNIIYLFDSKYYQLIKMVADIHHIDAHIWTNDDTGYLYADDTFSLSATLTNKRDRIRFIDRYKTKMKITIYEKLTLEDLIGLIEANVDIKEYLKLIESSHINAEILHKEILNLTEEYFISMGILSKCNLNLEDFIHRILSHYYIAEKDTIKDNLEYITEEMWLSELKLIEEEYMIHNNILNKEYLYANIEKYDIDLLLTAYEHYLRFNDDINILFKSLHLKDRLNLIENVKRLITIYHNDTISLDEEYTMSANINYTGSIDTQYSTDMETNRSDITVKENSHFRDRLILIYDE